MAINEKLKALHDVKGFIGAGVFSPDGEFVDGDTEISGLRMEVLGSLLNDVLVGAQQMAKDSGFGHADFIQINSDAGMMLAKSYDKDGKHFHTVMFLKPDGNIAMAKMKLNSVVEALAEEF